MTSLVRVTRGVWRPAESVDTLPGRCAAILGVMPPGSVIAGRTAARLHGLWLPDEEVHRIEVILRRHAGSPRAYAGSTRREVSARRRRLVPSEVCVVDGLPVTSLARTWIDLAEHLTLPDLVAAGDCALRYDVGSDDLDVAISRAVHRRGVVRAREAFLLLDARSRSRPETHLRVGLVTRGLPVPAVNMPIHDELGEPDLSYDHARLAIEYNGAGHADAARMRRDITRTLDFGRRGDWQIVVVGAPEVFRRMDQTASWVRELLAERTARADARPRRRSEW